VRESLPEGKTTRIEKLTQKDYPKKKLTQEEILPEEKACSESLLLLNRYFS
jgi:hypothetical protein